MAEQTGPSVAAIRAKQATMSERQRTAAAADQVLAATLRDAHAAAAAARDRLDAIAADIDACVRSQETLALDTPLGSRDVQHLLLVKQRELIAVLEEAQRDDAARRAVLESLRVQYGATGNAP
jgi:hypothetical protein